MLTRRTRVCSWIARVAVLLVFAWNLQCAFAFLFSPEAYVGGFELAGVSGIAAIQGIAVAFLMWNATYPLVILNPLRHYALFAVVLAQQLIGLVGESYILLSLEPGHTSLAASLSRFIIFDGVGLALMALGFVLLLPHYISNRKAGRTRGEGSRGLT